MEQQTGGYVYVQSNDAEANEAIVYARDDGGRLERRGSFPTGGKGSGKPHLASQSSVVLAGGRLFVANAGSADVTVFSVDGAGLSVSGRAASGGAAPTSVAVHGERVYVLNAGEPNVSGFVVSTDGRLSPIPGSSRPLAEGSDPAQVAFSPDGRTLLVTDRAHDAIHVFSVEADGVVSEAVAHRSSGPTPYGFDFTPDGTVVVTEAAGAQVGKASASSYRLDAPNRLVPVSGAVGSTRSEVCWAAVSKDGRTVFVTNFGDGTISTYAIATDGSIELREAVAATTVDGGPGIRDEALTGDGRFLYALHADARRVFGWEVRQDGTLAAVGSANGLPATAAGLAAS